MVKMDFEVHLKAIAKMPLGSIAAVAVLLLLATQLSLQTMKTQKNSIHLLLLVKKKKKMVMLLLLSQQQQQQRTMNQALTRQLRRASFVSTKEKTHLFVCLVMRFFEALESEMRSPTTDLSYWDLMALRYWCCYCQHHCHLHHHDSWYAIVSVAFFFFV